MWKIIKGSFTAGRELIGIIGEGKTLVEDGLDDLTNGMKTFRLQLENVNHELDLKKRIHQLELCHIIIGKNKKRTPSNYHNLHKFYDLSNSSITNSIGILKKAISEPQLRPLVQNFLERIKAEFSSAIDGNKELAADLKKMRSKGLKKGSTMFEAFEYYLDVTPLEELEMKVKPELPSIIEGNNSIVQIHNHIVNSKLQ